MTLLHVFNEYGQKVRTPSVKCNLSYSKKRTIWKWKIKQVCTLHKFHFQTNIITETMHRQVHALVKNYTIHWCTVRKIHTPEQVSLSRIRIKFSIFWHNVLGPVSYNNFCVFIKNVTTPLCSSFCFWIVIWLMTSPIYRFSTKPRLLSC